MLTPTFSDLKINSCGYLIKIWSDSMRKAVEKKERCMISGPNHIYDSCTFASTQQGFLEKSINIPYLKSILSPLHLESSKIFLLEHYLTLHQ